MSLDDDDDDADDVPRPPLPPDDRLWRHPSELSLHGPAGRPVPGAAARLPSRGAAWGAVVVAGLTGAVLMAGVLALSGQLSDDPGRETVERVAGTPIVSTPMLRGDATADVATVVRALQPSIVRLEVTSDGGATIGSGVVFREDGMVLTSAHLVEQAERVRVRLADGRRLDGAVIGIDALTDVAVVDVEAAGLTVATLGSIDGLEIGAPALVIGTPPGDGSASTVSTGVISSLRRSIGLRDGGTLHGLLQTDAPIAASCSGGALVDADGEVIGIVSAFASGAADEADRFGFATPIDRASRVAHQLIAAGRARHGWLGVAGVDLSPDEASRMGVPGGARVQAVDDGSPADLAGLDDDDVITAIDGEGVESMPGLAVEIRDHEPGDEVEIGYWRDGEYAEARITVGERP